jgi:hypothetical protein
MGVCFAVSVTAFGAIAISDKSLKMGLADVTFIRGNYEGSYEKNE